jgi:hypothetical protein
MRKKNLNVDTNLNIHKRFNRRLLISISSILLDFEIKYYFSIILAQNFVVKCHCAFEFGFICEFK